MMPAMVAVAMAPATRRLSAAPRVEPTLDLVLADLESAALVGLINDYEMIVV